MHILILIVIVPLLVYASVGSMILLFLAVLHVLKWPGLPKYPSGSPELRFAVVVPAHNEEEGLASTLSSIAAMDYPAERFQVIVVADNCDDATATVARKAGARVLERHDAMRRGKGYALRFAFDTVLHEQFDAVVVIDADSRPTKNLLRAFSSALGAGKLAIQCRNGAENPETSALAWVLVLGSILENDFYHEPRARLGLPTILRGTGMCLAARVLREVPWDAYSITEDTEYGMVLMERGIDVTYLPGAGVLTRPPETFEQLRTQRERWATGNAVIARARLPKLIGNVMGSDGWRMADAAMSLLISSKPQLLASALVPFVASLLFQDAFIAAWGGIVLAMQACLLVIGVRAMKTASSSLAPLLLLPTVFWFLACTLAKACLNRTQKSWMRTGRS